MRSRSSILSWSIDVGGGPSTAVYDIADDQDGWVNEPSAANGRVFFGAATWKKQFDLPSPTATFTWNSVSASGGPVSAIVVPLKFEGFDWARTRAFGIAPSNGLPIVTMSLADGTTSIFANPNVGDRHLDWFRVTSAFVHVILQSAGPPYLHDMRIDATTGDVHDEVEFGGVMAGPNDLCGLEWTGGVDYNVACLADSSSTLRTFTTNAPVSTSLGVTDVLYVDAAWAYVSIAGDHPHLSRFSLADAHEELLMEDTMTLAATGFGSCVFAMTWKSTGATLWRLSP